MDAVAMKLRLNTEYSEAELDFVNRNSCQILSEIQLSKTSFSAQEAPRRMLKYHGTYVAEICDAGEGGLIWAVLEKKKGIYHVSSCFEDLEVLEQSI